MSQTRGENVIIRTGGFGLVTGVIVPYYRSYLQFTVWYYRQLLHLTAHTESSWSVVLHQTPSTGFQRWTFPFMASQTVPVP
jgi:hypothetical protein